MTKPSLPFSPTAESLVIGGTYEHYKKNCYKILALGRHTETLEELVVYQDSDGGIWARPVAMFCESVLIEGKHIPRFRLIEK